MTNTDDTASGTGGATGTTAALVLADGTVFRGRGIGAGRDYILFLISGLLPYHGGSVTLDGEHLESYAPGRRARLADPRPIA